MMRKYSAMLAIIFILIVSNIYAAPDAIMADFTYSSGPYSVPATIQFINTSTSSGIMVSWIWDFGDGTQGNLLQNPSPTYIVAGVYAVRLSVVNDMGESDTVTKLISLLPVNNVTANFGFSNAQPVLSTMQFVDMSTTASGFIASWLWDFGDGMTAAIQNPYHVYAVSGVYTVALTVTDNFGERDTITQSISVLPDGEQKAALCPSVDSTRLDSYFDGTNYQWQLSTDSVGTFIDIHDNSNYTGTNERFINLKNIPSSWTGYKYRCVTNDNPLAVYKIVFTNNFSGSADNTWENPVNWYCGNMPDANTDVVIPAGSTVVLNSNASCNTITVNPGASFTVNPGFTLTITH